MKRAPNAVKFLQIGGLLVAVGILVARTVPVLADQINAAVGAQSGDKGRQALAFLPNELWVHAGDSVTWAFPTEEPHTVTFLKPGQIRPPFPFGCDFPAGVPFGGTTPSGSSYPTTPCVDSGIFPGPTYTVVFPNPGNYKLVCLLHENMTGVVHVLAGGQPLPYDQTTYDQQASRQASDLLADASQLEGRGVATAQASNNAVSVGIGEVVATGGGSSTASVMRFLQSRIVVHVGETVEFTNLDPVTPHTVTFGVEPMDVVDPGPGVTGTADGALKAALAAPGGSAHSGILVASSQDHAVEPQTPLTVTRFRVKFNSPGNYDFICALHDDLGMKGRVVVVK